MMSIIRRIRERRRRARERQRQLAWAERTKAAIAAKDHDELSRLVMGPWLSRIIGVPQVVRLPRGWRVVDALRAAWSRRRVPHAKARTSDRRS